MKTTITIIQRHSKYNEREKHITREILIYLISKLFVKMLDTFKFPEKCIGGDLINNEYEEEYMNLYLIMNLAILLQSNV